MDTTESSIGLEQLKALDRVGIREKYDSQTHNKYEVVSPEGAVLLYAREDAGLLTRVLAGSTRAFEIDVFDMQHREVIKLRRPYTVGLDKMDVVVCGMPAAIVRKEVTFFKPVLTLNDAADQPLMRVKGPVSISAECDFELYSCKKKRIGLIRKKWRGAGQGAGQGTGQGAGQGAGQVTGQGTGQGAGGEQDSFLVCFPLELDVRYKAAVIGTCFLIDFLFYE